jgi:hypothetical protein
VARRNRGTAASRVQTELNGRVRAANGSAVSGSSMSDPDEPGARTIGAMALQRWAARDPGAAPRSAGVPPTRTSGPYDVDDVDPGQAAVDRVDFGAVRLPVPPGGEVTVEPEEGRLQAVHVMLRAGRLSVSALAAPRSDQLWPDLAREIDESLRDGGATVRSFTGEWGRELHARTGEASSVFVGVDGPRWMLYGVATGPTSATAELDAALRRMLRSTVVVRGRAPYPVRTVLPLTVPAHLGDVPSDPNPSGAFWAGPSGRQAGLDETALVAPVRPAGPADDSTGLLSAAVDEPTDPRGLPRVPPVGLGDSGGGAGPRVPGNAAGVAGLRNGAARGAGRNGSSRNGSSRNGATRNGAARNEAPRDGTGRNGVERTAAAANGVGRTGDERDEVARDRAPSAGTSGAGSARTGSPARPPQRRVADLLAEAERERNAGSRRAPEPAAPAPPRRPDVPRRPPERAEPPAAAVGPVSPATANGPLDGRRPAASHPTPSVDAWSTAAGSTAAESAATRFTAGRSAAAGAARPTDDRDDTPLYLGGPGAVDQQRTAIGDVPLYREVAESVPRRVERPGNDPRWPPTDAPPAGSEDWTVPIPVIRPEPEPEPEPRGRRARRRRDARADDIRADPWSGGERAEGRHGGHSTAGPGGPAGARAARRHPGAEREADEPGTRSRPAHARPADRSPEPFDRTPNGRHHRPGW